MTLNTTILKQPPIPNPLYLSIHLSNYQTNALPLPSLTGPNLVAFDLTGPKTHAIKTQARAAAITPYMVGFKFLVHNGKVYNDVYVTEEMVGRKLGEFSP